MTYGLDNNTTQTFTAMQIKDMIMNNRAWDYLQTLHERERIDIINKTFKNIYLETHNLEPEPLYIENNVLIIPNQKRTVSIIVEDDLNVELVKGIGVIKARISRTFRELQDILEIKNIKKQRSLAWKLYSYKCEQLGTEPEIRYPNGNTHDYIKLYKGLFT